MAIAPKIQSLITSCNSTTGGSATDLTTAISGVISGFGKTLVVTAPTGSTVTVSRTGYSTITGTEVSGTWTFQLPALGTWTVTATLGSQSATGTVTLTGATITLSYATPISDIALGTTVKLYEGGSWTDYNVVEKRTNAVAIIRSVNLDNVSMATDIVYNGGTIDTYLTTTYYNSFIAGVQNLMVEQPIKYVNSGAIDTINRKIFIPSYWEADQTSFSSSVIDGDAVWKNYLPSLSSMTNYFWLRTPYGSSTTQVMCYRSNYRNYAENPITNTHGILPAIWINASAGVDTDNDNHILY